MIVKKSLLLASPLLLLFACGIKDRNENIKIDYLGQQSPGSTAKEFAQGIVSTDSFEHSSPVFSPNGDVVLWNILSRSRPDYLLEAIYENGKWSAPHRPSFGDSTADDYYPSFSTDGKTLYFSSRRQEPAGYVHRDMRIWKVERNGNKWGAPVPFDTTVSKSHEYSHSVTDKNTIYFSTSQVGQTSWNIKKASLADGTYSEAITLPFGINSVNYEDGAFIAPDERYLIFESQRAEGIDGSIDLYISFKLDDGRWSMPVNMGPAVNTGKTERMAKISPDGKYLFFGSNRNPKPGSWGFDIFWIETSAINALKDSSLARVAIEQPLGDNLLKALEDGDNDRSAQLLKEWTAKYPGDMEGMRTYVGVLRRQKKYEEAEQVIASMPEEWMNSQMFKVDFAIIKFALHKNDEAVAIIEPLLVPSEELELRYWQIINGLTDTGLYDFADTYFEKLAAGGMHPVHIYNRACFYAKAGEKERAFRHLDQAVDNGYNTISQYENDTDLTSLKTDARWDKLRKKLK